MKQRLHWALTITALVVAVFGVTPLGSATVRTGLAAAKAPLGATGILASGPRGPRGRRGPKGPKGDRGRQGPRGARVVARARAKNTIMTSSGYPGTDDPLSGNTWVQGATEDDLILGAITYRSPSACNDTMAFLEVRIYVDGTLKAGSLDFSPLQPGGTRTFVKPVEFASGAKRPHTLTAKVVGTCGNGHYTVTALKLDVTALA
jgi:hypothetical protein